ncbi:hypothetical protein KGR20_19045 [Cytobacillus oceanisediminis]|nr:hypothetical protein [Cytobacillus oceanisediminis]
MKSGYNSREEERLMPRFPYKPFDSSTKFGIDFAKWINNFVDSVGMDLKETDTNFNNAVETVSNKAFDKVVGAAKIEWLPPVNTFNDLETTYPDVVEGKTVMTRDSGKVYRFDGDNWIEIQDIDPSAINEVDNRLTAQLATTGEQIGSTPNDISKSLWAEFEERRLNIMWYFTLVPDKSLPRDEWDWTNAIQTAQNDLASKGGGTIEFPYGVFKYEKLYYYPDKISIISEMNAELLSVAADGYAITIRAFEELDVHEYLEQAHAHELRGIKFTAENSNIFMFLSKGESSETGVKYASGWSFNRCSINGANAIEINSHTWCINIDKCLINPNQGYGIYMPSGGGNYGERINITNSIIDYAGIAIFNANSYGDIRINMTSIDYCDQAIVVRGGIVSVDQLFVESNRNLNWFDIEGYGAQLNIGAMQITDMYQSQRTKPLFRNEDSTNASMGAGLTFDSIKLVAGFSTSTFLIEGKGRVKAGRVDTYRDAYKPMIGRYLNELAFGDCNSDKSINEWSSHRYASEKAKLDTTDKYEGTASMKFSVSTNGYSAGQQIQFPCNAGDMIRIKYHIKTRNLQANNKMFVIERRFLNRKGDEISIGDLKRITADIDNWTEQFVVPYIEAPPGTAYVEFGMFGGSWTTDINVWMDDIVINVG